MIVHPIKKLLGAGITDICIVTGTEHMGDVVGLLGSGMDFGCEFTYRVQDEAGGIAQALGLAERFVDGDKCCVMLADNLFERSLRPVAERFEAQERGARVVLAELDDAEHLRHLGVAELDGDRVARIVEKPVDPPSRSAVTGVYFYDAQVWDVLPTLAPSGRGELEITDVNNWYVARGEMEADAIGGFWGDAGESIDAYYEVNDFVRRSRAGG
jgi:glucose-1-phosphate thymidylyltransferase